MKLPGVFVSATGTGAGKTFVARGLTRALVRRGHRVAAVKPIETGCAPDPLDAIALARAARRPELAHQPDFYRATRPLAPYAATLEGELPPPPLPELAAAIDRAAVDASFLLVEGAGGLLVPLDPTTAIADLIRALELPLLLVAPDALGVLSSTLTALESATSRSLAIAAIVLARHASSADPSVRTNETILRSRTGLPVLPFPATADDDDALADAALECGLVDLFPDRKR